MIQFETDIMSTGLSPAKFRESDLVDFVNDSYLLKSKDNINSIENYIVTCFCELRLPFPALAL